MPVQMPASGKRHWQTLLTGKPKFVLDVLTDIARQATSRRRDVEVFEHHVRAHGVRATFNVDDCASIGNKL